ncbi:MAG TPA: tRNA preQ1(34) S-adenosylmethionine ribosyltransferase-isomerase QueA [Acidimicrobiales bacterium]|nr:tRNA preQ1(34) S-adenosylmethionine ribosyltransferase-isomerase QueA [Acidimicrobiales bacterium]
MEAFDYPLPLAAVAQEPVEPRDAARLLVAPNDRSVEHRHVRDLPDLLQPGDLLVVNDTRVLPARLHLRKPTGGVVEVLLLEPVGGCWQALVRPSKKVAAGTVLLAAGDRPAVEVGEVLEGGRRLVRLLADPAELASLGEVPLPPYITRPLLDAERYQTVYARTPGSVAAPTAGLHLSHGVLDRCRARDVGLATVELIVGLDTFRPVVADDADDHVMHSERYAVPAATMDACRATREAGGRVVAVGTTTTRALESAAATGDLEGRTDLFIKGDYPFRMVDVLLTNFHLPRSSLLLLLAAFAGERWRALYDTALQEGYRFLSFGDAMLVDRAARP